MTNKKIIEKVLKPYGVIKDGRVMRICMIKALSLKEKEFNEKIDELIKRLVKLDLQNRFNKVNVIKAVDKILGVENE